MSGAGEQRAVLNPFWRIPSAAMGLLEEKKKKGTKVSLPPLLMRLFLKDG